MELHHTSGRTGLGLTLAASTMLLWAMLPIGLKLMLEYLDSATVICLRFLFAAVVLGSATLIRDRLPDFQSVAGRRSLLLPVATLFLAANYFFYMEGLDRTTPANAQVVIQLAPLLLAISGIFVFGERFNGWQWLGFSTLIAGLAIFSWDQLEAFVDSMERYLFGTLLMILAAVTWAVYGIAQKQLLLWWKSQQIMLVVFAGSALLFAPFADFSALGNLDGRGWGLLLFCSLNTLLAYGAFAEALAHLEASRVSAVLSLVPVATLVLLVLLSALAPAWSYPERLTWISFAGATLVVIGSLGVSLGQRAQRPT